MSKGWQIIDSACETCSTDCPDCGSARQRVADEIKHVRCPQCKQSFQLIWNSHTRGFDEKWLPQSLFMRGCPSGGIYDVSVECPHCHYEEEL